MTAKPETANFKNKMNNNNRQELQTKLEYETLLEEYKTLRAEIIEVEGFSRQVLNIALTAVGVLIAGAGFIIDRKLQILFLIFPLFLYGLAWTQVRYIFAILQMSNYLKTVLIPRARLILAELSSGNVHDVSLVLGWETWGKSILRRYGILALPVTGSHYGTILFAAILSVVAYFVLSDPNSNIPVSVIIVLVALNAIAFIYSVFVGFIAELGR